MARSLNSNVYFRSESILVSFVGPAKSNAARAKQYLNSEETTNTSSLDLRDHRGRASSSLKMKLLSLTFAGLLSSTAFAAKKSTGSTFETYHTRAVSSTPIGIDDQGYEQVTATPRDYSVAVLLTALEDRYGCKLCRDFQPEWNIIANSWQKGDKKGESRTLFATLDFGNGRATFMKVWLIEWSEGVSEFLTRNAAPTTDRSSPFPLSPYRRSQCEIRFATPAL
jgi:hypothetical protein